MDREPDGNDGQGEVDQEAADAGQVQGPAGRRARLVGGLPREFEIGSAVATRGALARHPVAITGVVITTASAVVFVALLIAMLVGMLNNPYAGLVVFVAVPAIFVLGLLLIPLGMRLQRRK